MYFTLVKPKVASASMQTNMSLLEALVRTARSRFTAQLAELHNQSPPTTLSERDGHSGKHDGHGQSLAGATRGMIAIIKVMDQMADELLLESKQSRDSVGHVSGNVHKIAFGRWWLLGGRTPNDISAVAVEEKLRRTPRLVISLLEVAAILEGTVVELMPVKEGRTLSKRDDVPVDQSGVMGF